MTPPHDPHSTGGADAHAPVDSAAAQAMFEKLPAQAILERLVAGEEEGPLIDRIVLELTRVGYGESQARAAGPQLLAMFRSQLGGVRGAILKGHLAKGQTRRDRVTPLLVAGETCLSVHHGRRPSPFALRLIPIAGDFLDKSREYVIAITESRVLILDGNAPDGDRQAIASIPHGQIESITTQTGALSSGVTLRTKQGMRYSFTDMFDSPPEMLVQAQQSAATDAARSAVVVPEFAHDLTRSGGEKVAGCLVVFIGIGLLGLAALGFWAGQPKVSALVGLAGLAFLWFGGLQRLFRR
ncbi:MAG: hypothetical protein R3F17_05605 [Planctomycetota bacterium]